MLLYSNGDKSKYQAGVNDTEVEFSLEYHISYVNVVPGSHLAIQLESNDLRGKRSDYVHLREPLLYSVY